MRKSFLEKRKQRLISKREQLTARALASTDANEVRSINGELEDINADIAEIDEEIAMIADEERSASGLNHIQPAGANLVNGNIAAAYQQNAAATQQRTAEDPHNTMEYRTAFMRYVQTGAPIEQRGDAISTVDTGAAIPVTVMNEVINTVRKRYGNLYAKTRKTNVRGGIEYAVGALKATFKWINENTVSPRQKMDALAKVSFSYHTAEIRIAQTFLSNILTLEAFESKIAECIAVAYLQAMDYGIVNGSGDGQMLGILNDTRVTGQAGHVIEFTAADMGDWQTWRKEFFAKLPLGYRDGEFIFPIATIDSYLETMADDNGNPIFRQATGLEVNSGDALNPNGRFFGRNISVVEPDILPDFDSASANDIVGIFWQPLDYAINENFGFTMRRYFDEETNEWIDKAIVVVDGKVLNPAGIYLIKKVTSHE